MSIKDKLIKASTSKLTAPLDKSKFFNDKDVVRVPVPIINIALSGSLTGGLQSGLTILAGPSKHFKSSLALLLVAAYLKKYKDAVCLFCDSEFGITSEYLMSMGIDPSRVIHTPIQDVSQLKIDLTNQLDVIERGDKVIVLIDSIGNLASKKEKEDALNEKSVADMGRAKDLKSLFRIITPYFTIKDVPCIAINHTIQTMEMFSKEVMTGGQGPMLAADTVFFIGKRQIKDGTELKGYEFILKAEKSRMVKEKSAFGLTVNFDGGIDPYSGLFEMARAIGFIDSPKKGWYSRVFEIDGEKQTETKLWRERDTDNKEFWGPLFKHEPFRQAIEDKFKLKGIDDKEVQQEIDDLLSADVSESVDVDMNASNPESDLDEMGDYDE